MRIDSTHKPWLWISIATVALSAGAYIVSALLSVRKRFPIWRIGRARIWMKAHLWLGFLALPLVLFHAAFHARGLLAAVLMLLTVVVVVSGIFGAWLQHTLPSRMFREVPYET